jgi:hypothetical protein
MNINFLYVDVLDKYKNDRESIQNIYRNLVDIYFKIVENIEKIEKYENIDENLIK